MNQVFLKGNSGKDANVQTSKNGKPYIQLSIATSRKVGDGYETDWHNVTVFGNQAVPVKKGDIVFVSGQYVTNTWQDKDGSKRTTQQVTAFEMMVMEKQIQQRPEPSHYPDNAPFL